LTQPTSSFAQDFDTSSDKDLIVQIIEESLFDQSEGLDTLAQKISYLASKDGLVQIGQNLKVHETYLKVMRTSRAYNMDESMKNHIYNLGMLIPFSELAEIFAGPMVFSAASGAELPAGVVGFSTAIASTFALPGVDPICFLVIGLYFLEPIQKGVTKVRKTFVKNVLLPIDNKLFKKNLKNKDAHQLPAKLYTFALNNGYNFSLSKNKNGNLEYILIKSGQVTKLEFSKDMGINYLKSVELSRGAESNLKQISKILGLDAKLAVSEFLKKRYSESYIKKAYVEAVTDSRVVFSENSIKINAKINKKNKSSLGLVSCQLSLL